MIANSNRDPKKQKTPFEPGDFFPTLKAIVEERAEIEQENSERETYRDHTGRVKTKQTWQEMLAVVTQINQQNKGLDLRQPAAESTNGQS